MRQIKRKSTWPVWAKYYARDRNGCAYIYEYKPERFEIAWSQFPKNAGRIMHADDDGIYGPELCERWEDSLSEIVTEITPSAEYVTVVLRVHATTQLPHVPKILREIAERVEREGGGCCCCRAVGLSESGTDWDWKICKQQEGMQDEGS